MSEGRVRWEGESKGKSERVQERRRGRERETRDLATPSQCQARRGGQGLRKISELRNIQIYFLTDIRFFSKYFHSMQETIWFEDKAVQGKLIASDCENKRKWGRRQTVSIKVRWKVPWWPHLGRVYVAGGKKYRLRNWDLVLILDFRLSQRSEKIQKDIFHNIQRFQGIY